MRVRAAPESRALKTQIHIMFEWSFRITAQECMVQPRRPVRMRFLYPPTIPPRMVARGFLSRRSESLVSYGRTKAVHAITVAFGEKSGPLGAASSHVQSFGLTTRSA